MELTTRETAERLGVNQSRARALVAAGTLRSRRVGSQWLIDADSVARQALFSEAAATSRAMSTRIAWGAGALADGEDAAWLAASERTRLRKRLRGADNAETLQRWLTARSTRTIRYMVGGGDLEALLNSDGVIRTGVSAADAYALGLGTGGAGDAYVSQNVADRLVRDFYLIEGGSGNLTLRIVDHDFHTTTARRLDGQTVTTRLMVGVDLADDTDTRTRSTGRTLLTRVLDDQKSAH